MATYKDDLDKLRQGTDSQSGDPNNASSADSSTGASSGNDSNSRNAHFSETGFTPQEKKLPYIQRISLPFIQHSSIAALCFILVALLWVAISDTVFASIHEIDRDTIMRLMIKDAIYVIVSAAIMYQVLRAQFSHYYHLEQDYMASEENVRKWKSIQHSMMETIPDTLAYTLDCDFHYTSFNNRHKYSMLRMWHQEIRMGEPFLDYIPDEDLREKTQQTLQRVLNGEYISEIEKFGDNDLTASYWKTYYAPILDDDRQIIGISCFISNITSLKQSQSKNLFLSYHDSLTKLYNRVYAEELFAQAETEELVPYSILSIEIQGMRQINNNYGTETGDKLLIKVSELLTRCIKDNGFIVKWASDEFIVLLPDTDATMAEALSNICRCEFSGVTINGVPIRAYFGFATRTDMNTSISSLLQSAQTHAESQEYL